MPGTARWVQTMNTGLPEGAPVSPMTFWNVTHEGPDTNVSSCHARVAVGGGGAVAVISTETFVPTWPIRQ